MAAAWTFGTPGGVDPELPKRVRQAWSDRQAAKAAENLDIMIAAAGAEPAAIPYVDPTNPLLPADRDALADRAQRTTVSVEWDGFPAAVTAAFGDGDAALRARAEKGSDDFGALVAVDDDQNRVELPVRHRQDEYLEWEAE